MKIVETTITRDVPVDPAVVLWNHLDFAHLTVVHRNYTQAQLVYEDDNVVLERLTHRIPCVPLLRSRSLHFFLKRPPGELLAFTQGALGVPIVTRIRVARTGEDRSRVTVTYRFALEGWKRCLAPFLPALARRWNDRTWREDLPLKLRRQRALRAGFRDFEGLPEKVCDRKREGPLATGFQVRPSMLFPEAAMALSRVFLDEGNAQPEPGTGEIPDTAG